MRVRRGRRPAWRPLWISAVAATALGLVAAQTAAAAAGTRDVAVVDSGGILYGVSASGTADAWAVGATPGNPIILHWDGTSWTPATVPATKEGHLTAVSAPSATDAWAVGLEEGTGANLYNLALHWNGTAWAKVPTPSPGTGTVIDQLNAVSALSPTDAWAAGTYGELATHTNGPVMLHWNGTTWAQVTVPNPGNLSVLDAVDALSPTDVWAAGTYGSGAATQALLLHWNGSTWTQTASPIAINSGEVTALSAVSPTDVWAVGGYYNAKGVAKSLTLNWNGTKWTQVPSPSPGGTLDGAIITLNGVSALSATDAWAVGTDSHFRGSGTTARLLILRWNGTAWTQVPGPTLKLENGLASVAAVSATQAWAVGNTVKGESSARELVLSWNGTSWTRS
jgi:hypothetical protein